MDTQPNIDLRTESFESPEQNRSHWRSYFTSMQWLVFCLLIIIGLFFRWYDLAERPFHHDESMHAMFGYYYYDHPNTHYHKYNPMMHGPVLYHSLRVLYNLLGPSSWTARFPVALMGSLFLLLPFLFRRYFTRFGVMALTAAIALSPSLIYWSRFIIHDYYVLTALFITLYGVLMARPQNKVFFVMLGITLQWCIKANVFVTAAILLGYFILDYVIKYLRQENLKDQFCKQLTSSWKPLLLVTGGIIFLICYFSLDPIIEARNYLYELNPRKTVGIFRSIFQFIPTDTFAIIEFLVIFPLLLYFFAAWFFRTFPCPDESPSFFEKAFRCLSQHKVLSLLSYLFCVLVYAYFYSAEFRHLKGIVDGLYREVFEYWINQHEIERIKGPFAFNLFFLSWYETLFIIAFLIHIVLFYLNTSKVFLKISLSYLALMLIVFSCYTFLPETLGLTDIEKASLWKFFKLKGIIDLIWFLFLLYHSVIVTFHHLLKKEPLLAFTGYYFLANFWTYSYLGEKVPWLATYPLVAGLVYLTLYFEDYFKKHPISNYQNFDLKKTLFWIGIIIVVFSLICLFDKPASSADNFLDAFFSYFKAQKSPENYVLLGLGLIFMLTAYFDNKISFFGKHNLCLFIFVLACLFNIRAAYLTNILHAGDSSEFISQVHTTHEFDKIMKDIRAEIENPLNITKPKVLVVEGGVWPATWYFTGVHEYSFNAPKAKRKKYKYILQDFHDTPKDVPEGYSVKKVTLRGWWVPDYKQMTFKKFIFYALTHNPWNATGYTFMHLLVKDE